MRRIVIIACVAAMAAQPAFAAELLFTEKAGEEAGFMGSWQGDPWWKLLAYCAGAHYGLRDMAQADDPATAAGRKAEGDRFVQLALDRARADRGLDDDGAVALLAPVIGIGRELVPDTAEKHGKTSTQFQLFNLQCGYAKELYAQVRPATAPAAPPVSDLAIAADARIRGGSLDGQAQWTVMIRCAKGFDQASRDAALPAMRRGMMAQYKQIYVNTAGQLLLRDRRLAEAEVRSLLGRAQATLPAIMPGGDDACLAAGRQVEAEAKTAAPSGGKGG